MISLPTLRRSPFIRKDGIITFNQQNRKVTAHKNTKTASVELLAGAILQGQLDLIFSISLPTLPRLQPLSNNLFHPHPNYKFKFAKFLSTLPRFFI